MIRKIVHTCRMCHFFMGIQFFKFCAETAGRMETIIPLLCDQGNAAGIMNGSILPARGKRKEFEVGTCLSIPSLRVIYKIFLIRLCINKCDHFFCKCA